MPASLSERLVIEEQVRHLGEDEVEVALERVAEAGRVVVAMLLEHAYEVHSHIAQLVHRARHVLDQHARACHPRPDTVSTLFTLCVFSRSLNRHACPTPAPAVQSTGHLTPYLTNLYP